MGYLSVRMQDSLARMRLLVVAFALVLLTRHTYLAGIPALPEVAQGLWLFALIHYTLTAWSHRKRRASPVRH